MTHRAYIFLSSDSTVEIQVYVDGAKSVSPRSTISGYYDYVTDQGTMRGLYS